MYVYSLKVAKACCLLFVVLGLVACGEGRGPAEDPDVALRQRVQGYWQALLERDYDTAYERYVSPTYRAAFTQQYFYRRYGEQLRRDRVEVRRITFTDETKSAAEVLVAIYFTTEVGGKLEQLDGESKEHWAKIDGQWYLVPGSEGAL